MSVSCKSCVNLVVYESQPKLAWRREGRKRKRKQKTFINK
jgi:hypothetical protein